MRTDHGSVLAQTLVLATDTPALDGGLHAGRLEPRRSCTLSYRVAAGASPQGMYVSADVPNRSVRSVPVDGEEFLLVGGNDQVVGRGQRARRSQTSQHTRHTRQTQDTLDTLDTLDQVEDLRRWTLDVFPEAEELHSWCAQDYRSENGIPVVGPLTGEDPRLLCASGFGPWEMANGAAAALALAGWVTGDVPDWAQVYRERRGPGARPPSAADMHTQTRRSGHTRSAG